MHFQPAPVGAASAVVDVLANLTADLDDPARRPRPDALQEVLAGVRAMVPGALSASVSWCRTPNGKLETAAATHDVAADADRRQVAGGEGPALDALRGEVVAAFGPDLGRRWPVLGDQLAQLGIFAVCALPLPGLPGRGSLNLYGDAPIPYGEGEPGTEVTAVAAAVAAVALAALTTCERAANLDVALASSRQIAAAVGIVMGQYRCPYDEAFARIRTVSQRTHRKMRELADTIMFTGALPEVGASESLAG